ncbi:hypothetical protein [Aquimarina addita]
MKNKIKFYYLDKLVYNDPKMSILEKKRVNQESAVDSDFSVNLTSKTYFDL